MVETVVTHERGGGVSRRIVRDVRTGEVLRQDVTVQTPPATAVVDALRGMLYDPDRPQLDPNDLLRELGRVIDPDSMNHNCPFCGKTMSWQLFIAHLVPCVTKWDKPRPTVWRVGRDIDA